MKKYLEDDYSRQELDELLGYLHVGEDALYEEITARLWQHIGNEKILDNRKAEALIETAVNTGSKRKSKRSMRTRWYQAAAAAVLVLLIGAGINYLAPQSAQQSEGVAPQLVKYYKNDVKPGGTRAILKAGTAEVLLNKNDTTFLLAGNIVNIKQGGVKVAGKKPVQYTLITPKGGEYSMVLEDGTKVWLNADSKLIYPSEFNSSTRRVQLTGEAYFEVKTDPAHPFVVHTENQDIRVLGTEFNIQAYPNESKSITTLVNGKVQVNAKKGKMQLQQGQQAILTKDGGLSLNPEADIEQAVAWKEGYFRFDYTDIYEIMHQLSRWYDVEVDYENGVQHREFLAFINRDNNISEILEMLEETGEIRFAIDGHKVKVMNMRK